MANINSKEKSFKVLFSSVKFRLHHSGKAMSMQIGNGTVMEQMADAQPKSFIPDLSFL